MVKCRRHHIATQPERVLIRFRGKTSTVWQPRQSNRPAPQVIIHASVALASDNNNQAARRLTSWAEEAINTIEDGGEFDPADDIDGTIVGSEGLANELLGERSLALESLGRATVLGEPGRFNRTFTSDGPVMTGLMEALADAVQRDDGPAESGPPSYLAYLLQEMKAKPVTASAQFAAAGLGDPLTARKIEILRLIAAGHVK